MEKQSSAQDFMHGSIFVLLHRFVEHTYGTGIWEKVLAGAGVENTGYQLHEMYPTDDLFALAHQISEFSGDSVYDLMEQYGEFMVPDLLQMYKKYFLPEWRTYEMLLYTEEKMHKAVRMEDGRTAPPRLTVTKQDKNRLVIDYYSKRRLSGVAVGIIRGIARYYHEEDKVTVTRLSKPEAEQVQILVDFNW
ncbi:heme NO-binding domain-containing protein [Rufibacter psychrotolerans]|uniref:heme NO-binding domain-containing protein n=1 Tax=Rufibacter psychrotolerans TaxID=2812556 RepID=UPI001966D601|nr:heme NO-binding domain-containing protein [Rufibacter sp. SYSU D00308]